MARASSRLVGTEPDNVTTPSRVVTSIFTAPISGSFRSAVFTRAVIASSSNEIECGGRTGPRLHAGSAHVRQMRRSSRAPTDRDKRVYAPPTT